MFGHPQAGHQQQRPASGANAGQWMAHADSVSCSQYLCPDTLVCVSNPSDCPCPDVQDVKCLIPDSDDKGGATVVCARGTLDCATVEQLSRKLS
ncbi:hypothetical protein IEO21_00732 [Rhodonia placenta]|uniref:Long chronological lifespan protein 2 n=1 Tax=Rhodonia placenta TaxID=104341 RepID=A0A8H7PB59_9APHY|nr:hypothetical protein IEO21_00732 [Postia placenta]